MTTRFPEATPPDPAAVQSMLRQAIALRKQNNLDGTEQLLNAALAIDPQNYDAMHMLGVLKFESGDGTRAVELISTAIRINGTQAAAHYNLGNAFRLLKRHTEAVECYDRAVALRPDYARAYNNLANSLRDAGRSEQAISSYDRAVAIDPGFADAWHNRGNVLNELKRGDEAITSYRRALAAGGDAARLEFELAALGAGAMPASAPPLFVTNLFDGYAEKFDQHLVNGLNYQTPQAAVNAVSKLLDGSAREILDLGCGTGLCGPLLRPLAKTLTGVDLSQNMLNKAAERELYDELICAEAAQYLQTCKTDFDLVIATDVFVYIGDLNAVFAGARRALGAAGFFVFSVECGEKQDFVLQESKRYAHSEAYLRRLAGEHDLRIEQIESRFIRKDGAADISGLIAVMRRH